MPPGLILFDTSYVASPRSDFPNLPAGRQAGQLFNQHGALRADITIDDIPLILGKHTLNYVWPTWENISYRLIYSKYTSDGDVLTGTYHVFEQNDANFIDIKELNLSTGDIEGSFQAVVVRDSLWTPAGHAPDTIRITDGSFYGKIYWE